jgi:hypothetical protein
MNSLFNQFFFLSGEKLINFSKLLVSKITEKINDDLYKGLLLNMPNKNNSYASATLNKNCLENDFDCEIICNDCTKRCVSKFHFLGLECIYCNGFNTNKC